MHRDDRMNQVNSANAQSVLITEDDVITRLCLAEYLRSCGFAVIEAAGAEEAKIVLRDGPRVDVLLADAQLAGSTSGFALAQWARRYRPHVDVVLAGTLAHKADAAANLCETGSGPNSILERIQAMRARSKRIRPAVIRHRSKRAQS